MKTTGIYKLLGLCMLAGVVLMVIGFASGGARRGMYVDLNGIHISDEGSQMNISESNLDKFTSIDIYADLSNIEFIASDKYGFEINYSTRYGKPTWSLNDGTLKISDGFKSLRSINFFNLDFGIFGYNAENYIKVYLPNNATLENVTLTLSCGSLKAGNFEADNVNIKNNLGDVKLNGVTSNILTAGLDCGSIDIDNSKIGELDAENNLGNITIKNSVVGNSDIKVDCGDARLSGDFTGRTVVENNLGDIKVDLSRAKEYYNINLSTSLGDIKIDNDRMGNNAAITNGNPENILKIENDCGDIEVNFGK